LKIEDSDFHTTTVTMVPEMYAKARGEKRLRGPTKIAQDPSAHVSSPKLMALDDAHYTVYNLSLG